jgi:protoporphyrinogen IX oxidase
MLALWLKALHLFFVISWFAGIFYLPRLYVHHAMVPADDRPTLERLKIMERKLFRFMTPLAVLALVFGIALTVHYGLTFFRTSAWLHAKLALVLAMCAYHGYLGHLLRVFAEDRNVRSHRFYRVMNELPVLALFAVVVLAVVKPF